MKRLAIIIGAFTLVLGFLGGFGYRQRVVEPGGAAHPKDQRRILYYVDPMHPGYKSDKPGIAPDCGMKLVPVYEGGDAPATLASDGNSETMPAHLLNISPEKQQLIGVRFGEVQLTTASSTIRAVGKVAQDETSMVRIHPKVEGWIEKVHVDFTGAPVQKGQPLLTIYSPEMLSAEQEYLLALSAREIMRRSTLPEAGENADALIRASRMRLELWDLSRAQIDELEKTRQPIRSITLFAPVSGYVMARNAFPSQKVTPETELYAVGNLNRVWIVADVFESESAHVRVGQTALIGLPSDSRKAFRARVSFIQPQMDAATRTLKVRLEAPNPGLELKPEMFVDVELQVDAARKITVPAEAVLDSGLHKTVYVDRGDGALEPRDVETGDRLGDRIEILRGLKPGERIVTSGNFLIDSESRLKEAAPHEGHQHD